MPVEAPPAPAVAPAATPPPTQAPAPTHTNLTEPLRGTEPPKPGSARERSRQALDKKWGDPNAPIRPGATEPAKPAEPVKPADAPAPKPGEKAADEPTAPPETPLDITPEQKKQNPWKLFREQKTRADKLEQQISEGKTGALSEKERTEFQEKLTKTEARLKEYEDEIRFKSYEKSDEFRTKYEEPYEKAWNKHMGELKQVPVLGKDGETRLATHQDLLELVDLPLGTARALANEKWGDFAQDAMTARKEIRDLFEAKHNALEEARKTGADREKQFQEKSKAWRDGVQKHIKETWETANTEALADPRNGEYFKPAEGDDKRNELLTKGFHLVDEAFAMNPMDPKHSPEERAKIVRLQAAVRNRASSWGVLNLTISRMKAEIEQLKKSNGEYKGSQPPAAGGTQTPGGPPSGMSAREKMRTAGDKWAR